MDKSKFINNKIDLNDATESLPDQQTDKALGKERSGKTGIEIVGDVPWLRHFCQFYRSRQDLIEMLVPYFKEGLEDNEFCMWGAFIH